MRKINLLITLAAFFIFHPVTGKQIPQSTALQVAENYLKKDGMQVRRSKAMTLTPVYTARSGPTLRASGGNQPVVCYYVFNVNDNDGFIMVSGDDIAVPVLGYALTGKYNTGNYPPAFRAWMEEREKEIAHGIQTGVTQGDEIREKWNNYLSGNIPLTDAAAVGPLLKTRWDQSEPFNTLCPVVSGQRTVTGCLATSMAQIMKYYNHPAKGTGIAPAYTTRSGIPIAAENLEVNYQWDLMANTYPMVAPQDPGNAVATLMYHCGVTMEMNYRPAIQGGSGAYTEDIVKVLPLYFGYDKSIRYKSRADFTDYEWHAMLKKELDAKRPVFYGGESASGGHAFICDGYDNQEMFHFNWGWGGLFDGYFATNALNPGSGGSGSGSGTYNLSQEIIIYVMPDQGGTPPYELTYINTLSVTSTVSSANRGEGFAVSLPIYNSGPGIFTGWLGIGVVDANNKITEVIGELPTQVTYEKNKVYTPFPEINCMFSASFPPGSYTLMGIAAAEAGEWEIIRANPGSGGKLTMQLSSGIQAHSLKLTQATALNSSKNNVARGENLTLAFSLHNTATTGFKGDIGIGVCDNTGQILAVAGTKKFTLGQNQAVTATELNGAFPADATPGTYRLRVVAKPEGQQEYSLVKGWDSSVKEEIIITLNQQLFDDKSKLHIAGPGLIVTPQPLIKGEAISVTSGLANLGDTDFNGEVEAAIYSAGDVLLQLIESKPVYLKKGVTDAVIEFSNPRLEISGNHKLRIYYKAFTGEKKPADNYLTYQNDIAISIRNDEGELYLHDPGYTITSGSLKKGEPIAFSVGLKNEGNSHFNGEIEAGIYSLTGQLLQVIEQKTFNLAAGATGEAAFATAKLEVAGTYKVRIHYTSPAGEKRLVAETAVYRNDFDITILEGDADLYIWNPGITITSGQLKKGEEVNFTVGLKNQGYGDFAGEVEAALYSPTGLFIKEVGKKTVSIATSDTLLVHFTVDKLEISGDYKIRIYFNHAADGQKLAGNNPPYINDLDITIRKDDGDLYLCEPGVGVISGRLKKGEAVTFAVGLKNLGESDFNGEVETRLYSLSGPLVQVIDKKAVSIASSDSVTTDFYTGQLGVTGDYKLRVYFTTPGGEMKPAGSLLAYENDIFVTIEDEDIPVEGLQLVDPGITLTSGSLRKGEAITFAVGLKNTGTGNFANEVGAELYAMTGEFVQLIDKKAVQLLSGHSTVAGFTVGKLEVAGDYRLHIYFLNLLGEKKMVTGSAVYPNGIPVTIEEQHTPPPPVESLTLADPGITLVSGTPKKGQAIAFSVGLKNTGNTGFSGKVGMELWNAAGGFVQLIEEKTIQLVSGSTVVTEFSLAQLNVSGEFSVQLYFINRQGEKKPVNSTSSYPNNIRITIEEETPVSTSPAGNTPLSFFPNPVREVLHITGIPHPPKAIRIYDTSGHIQHMTRLDESEIEAHISLGHLAPGLYFLTLETTKKVYRTKIVKF